MKAKALSGRLSFRLRCSPCCGAYLAGETDLEHQAKATEDKLWSILAKQRNGVLEYWSIGISGRDQLHPLRRIENGSSGAPGRCPLSIPTLDAGASARIS